MSLNAQEFKNSQTNPFEYPKYANDVIVNDNSSVNQRNAKLAVAYNGWLYSAFTTVDQNKGGIKIMCSKDNGTTW